jgi:hypothetical protein
VIYLGCGNFKQTFVLDPESGVDIMRRLRETRVSSIAAFVAFREGNNGCNAKPPIRKTVSLE